MLEPFSSASREIVTILKFPSNSFFDNRLVKQLEFSFAEALSSR
jgi:hypothetical protein